MQQNTALDDGWNGLPEFYRGHLDSFATSVVRLCEVARPLKLCAHTSMDALCVSTAATFPEWIGAPSVIIVPHSNGSYRVLYSPRGPEADPDSELVCTDDTLVEKVTPLFKRLTHEKE